MKKLFHSMIAGFGLITVLAGGTLPANGASMTSDWQGIQEAEVRLIAGHVDGRGDMLGLQFAMSPKWKVYWRSPGDAGFPPRPNWSGTEGARQMKLEWPLPTRFTFYGLETFGYEDEIILPVRLDRTGSEVKVELELFYAACADICVPVTAHLSLALPEGAWPENRYAKAIASALSTAPLNHAEAMQAKDATVRGNQLHVRMTTPVALEQPDLIVEGPADAVFGPSACQPVDTETTCLVPILEGAENDVLTGQQVRLTLFDKTYAAEAEITVTGQ